MKTTIAAAIAAITLAGCFGPSQSLRVVDVAKLQPAQAGVAQAVQVLESAPAGATVIGPIEATSCRNKFWDPAPTEANALAQLQVKAAEMGATALVGVTYAKGTDAILHNCWETIRATGTAVR